MKIMAKKKNHNADIKNPNKGTKGTNKTFDKNQGNRGKQLNPNNKKYKSCNLPKDVGKFIQKQEEEFGKPIKDVLPIIQKRMVKKGKKIEKGSIFAKTQSAIDKCNKQ